jgi:hypothetical protein
MVADGVVFVSNHPSLRKSTIQKYRTAVPRPGVGKAY